MGRHWWYSSRLGSFSMKALVSSFSVGTSVFGAQAFQSFEQTGHSAFVLSSVQGTVQVQASGDSPLQADRSAPSAEQTGQPVFTLPSAQGAVQVQVFVSGCGSVTSGTSDSTSGTGAGEAGSSANAGMPLMPQIIAADRINDSVLFHLCFAIVPPRKWPKLRILPLAFLCGLLGKSADIASFFSVKNVWFIVHISPLAEKISSFLIPGKASASIPKYFNTAGRLLPGNQCEMLRELTVRILVISPKSGSCFNHIPWKSKKYYGYSPLFLFIFNNESEDKKKNPKE